jgi:hypothetical protein
MAHLRDDAYEPIAANRETYDIPLRGACPTARPFRSWGRSGREKRLRHPGGSLPRVRRALRNLRDGTRTRR